MNRLPSISLSAIPTRACFPLREQSCQGSPPAPCSCCSNRRRNRSWRADRDVKSVIFPPPRINSRCDHYSCVPKCAENPRGINWPNCRLLNCHLDAGRYLLLRRLSRCVINFHRTSNVLKHARNFALIANCFLIGCRRRHRDRRSCHRIVQASRDIFSLLRRDMAWWLLFHPVLTVTGSTS